MDHSNRGLTTLSGDCRLMIQNHPDGFVIKMEEGCLIIMLVCIT